MFSRSIAAQTEQQFLSQGYDDMLSAEKTAWAGCLKSNAPYAVWRGASSLVAGVSPNGKHSSCHFLAR